MGNGTLPLQSPRVNGSLKRAIEGHSGKLTNAIAWDRKPASRRLTPLSQNQHREANASVRIYIYAHACVLEFTVAPNAALGMIVLPHHRVQLAGSWDEQLCSNVCLYEVKRPQSKCHQVGYVTMSDYEGKEWTVSKPQLGDCYVMKWEDAKS